MNEVLISEVFLKIINMSISASWLVLVVLLLRPVMKNAPKWVRVLLWGIVAVKLICPFSFESKLSLIPSGETVSPKIMMDWTPEIATGIGFLDRIVNPVITETFAPKPIASANPLQILIPVAAHVWLVGIAVMLIYIAVSYLLLRRKVSTAVLLRNNIYQSENVDSPFVLGIIKPRIYLPYEMDEGSLINVVAHEESHIRRKDHWWKPLGFAVLVFYWFNPLLWVGYILLCRDIELACDEKVIKELDNEAKADYVQALVDCSVGRRRIAACPLAFGEVGVKQRVKSVLQYKKPPFWMVVGAIVICVAVAVCFLTNPKQEYRGETDPEKLSQKQRVLMEQYPDYFGVDASRGLDIYVWQTSENTYSFGLQPHSDKKQDMWSVELMRMEGATAEQMREILRSYAVERDDMVLVLWQHPLSNYLPDYLIMTEGEDMQIKQKAFADYIYKMLFGEGMAENMEAGDF